MYNAFGQGVTTDYQVENCFSMFSSKDRVLKDALKQEHEVGFDSFKSIGGIQSVQKFPKLSLDISKFQ